MNDVKFHKAKHTKEKTKQTFSNTSSNPKAGIVSNHRQHPLQTPPQQQTPSASPPQTV
jgi:hypothetical protein